MSRFSNTAAALLALALVLLPVAVGVAQEEAPLRLEEGRFFIESIAVEDCKALSREIIVSESRLVEGQEYSESQLRDAIHRIKRLPLVLDAEFVLKKGSSRGLYQLVVTVRETRLWFWGLDIDIAAWGEPVSVQGLETTDIVAGSNGLIGRRFPAGRHGIFYAALGGTEGTIQAGYTHYDPFGRGGVLGISYGYADCQPSDPEDASVSDPGDDGCQTEILGLGLDPTYSSWGTLGQSHRVRLILGVPIEGNNSFRLLGSYRSADRSLRRQALQTDPRRFGLADDRTDVEVNAAWVYNSVDDPVFPTSGRLLEAGLDFKLLNADVTQVDLTAEPATLVGDVDSMQLGALITGRWHRPLNPKHSLWYGGELFVGVARVEDLPSPDLELINNNTMVWTAAASFGHGAFLKRVREGKKWRDLRWDSTIQIFGNALASNPWPGWAPGYGLRISTGLTYRNTWGVLRLQVGYVDLEER
jgi:hypothetical protein